MVGAVAAKVFVSNMLLIANRLDHITPQTQGPTVIFLGWLKKSYEKILSFTYNFEYQNAIATYRALGQTILEINLKPLAKSHPHGTCMKKAKVDNID